MPPVLPDDTRRSISGTTSRSAPPTRRNRRSLQSRIPLSTRRASRAGLAQLVRHRPVARPTCRGSPTTLWYIRDYALDQQEPTASHSGFLRADWQDAFHIINLELSAFTNVDLQDGSSLSQITADYYLSNFWTIGAIAEANLGGGRSDWGSVPEAASVIVRLARFF